jgi:hypothetical protein
VRELNALIDVSHVPSAFASAADVPPCSAVVVCAPDRVGCDEAPATVAATLAFLDGLRDRGLPHICGWLLGTYGVCASDLLATHTFERTVTVPAASKDEEPTSRTERAALQYVPISHHVPHSTGAGGAEASAGLLARWHRMIAGTKRWAKFRTGYIAWAGLLAAAAKAQSTLQGVSADAVQETILSVAAAAGVSAAAAAACVSVAAIDGMVRGVGVEVVPVAAVLGGQVAQEAMKAVTGRDEPFESVFVFDGMGGTGGIVTSAFPQ